MLAEHEGPVLGWSREVPFSAAASNMDKPEVLLCPQASNPAVGLSFCTGIQRLPAPEGEFLSWTSVTNVLLLSVCLTFDKLELAIFEATACRS